MFVISETFNTMSYIHYICLTFFKFLLIYVYKSKSPFCLVKPFYINLLIKYYTYVLNGI